MVVATNRGVGFGAVIAILLGGWILGSGLSWLVKPIQNGCIMTYMFPTYIPVAFPANATSSRFGLFLYHEGWKKIDHDLHLMKLSGVPVLFIPGNGGSYKQVRSIAAESDRAFDGGPSEESFYQQAGFTPKEAGLDVGQRLGGLHKDLLYTAQEQYANKLDWFTVDLEGEHSAMDGRILEEHIEYVVHAINRILDRYKESLEARSQQTKDVGDFLPRNVILVGHSMGGFIARAAVVHPLLRKGAVETVVTLSSPHLLAPLPLQPSLGHIYSRVNQAWRSGYETPRGLAGFSKHNVEPALDRVVAVSIFGGIQDYQVRSRFASLDDIVPPTRGLTVGAPGMLNVWLSMDHQSILWCNQLVVQVAHTLLQLVDKKTGQPFERPQMRLAMFVTKLRSALPQTFGWLPSSKLQETALTLPEKSKELEENDSKTEEELRTIALQDIDLLKKESSINFLQSTEEQDSNLFACPKSTHWEETKEKDLNIDGPTMTVLAMDGKRRWLDIKKMTSNGKNWFTLVTNLAPCSGVTVHLWPEKAKNGQGKPATEVTMKMIQLPTGPSQAQIEPGGQSVQPPPSGVLHLSPDDLGGYGFLAVSVAPFAPVSGRQSPSVSMAVAQFYNPKKGKHVFSPWWFISSIFKQQGLVLKESHPLVVEITMAVSLGTLPMIAEVKTTGCGSTDSVLAHEKRSKAELNQLCKLRCFPPIVLVWDPPSGLEVFPNLYHETITVDSSPPVWGSQTRSESSIVLMLIDPHCEYHVDMKASLLAAASRFLIMHFLQIAAVTIAVMYFSMMRQARAWELDAPLPSVYSSIEANLMLPYPLVALALGPLLVYVILAVFGTHSVPPLLSFMLVSSVCYIFANGAVALVAIISTAVFFSAAFLQVFFKLRWQSWEDRRHVRVMRWVFSRMSGISSLQVVGIIRSKPTLTVAIVATVLVFFVHPAPGLIVLLLAHAWSCNAALCNYTLSNRQQMNVAKPIKGASSVGNGTDGWRGPLDSNASTDSIGIRFAESQLEIFHQRQGLFLLHLIATIMFMPSFVAWISRPGMERVLPGIWDSSLSFGLILHGLYASNVDVNMALFSKFRLPGSLLEYAGLSFIYGVSGIYCYISGLSLAPYRTFHAMAMIGYLTIAFKVWETRARGKGDLGTKRRHYHRYD